MAPISLFTALLCAAAAVDSFVGSVAAGDAHNSTNGHRRETRAAPACLYTKSWEPINNPSVLIPLYTDPSNVLGDANTCTNKYFLDVAKGCKAVAAVINPNTGPFSLDHWQIPGLKTCMRMLSGNNVMMVGYVYTKIAKMDPATGVWSTSGMRDMSEVARDMDRWVSIAQGIPNFRGFFLDDTTNYYQILHRAFGVDHLWWYRTLVNMGKQKLPNAQIVLNPGSFTDLRLMRADPANGYPVAAEITIPFEDYAWRWRPANNDCGSFKNAAQAAQGTFGPGPWCANVPNWDHVEPFREAVARREFKASAMAHSASRDFAFREASVARSNGFKYFYVSDVPLVQGPWGQVPRFWDEYLIYLNNGEGGGSVTGCEAPSSSVGPFAAGCLQKWWQASGCTLSGTTAPKHGDQYWYNLGAHVSINQIRADFNEYARLAAANTPTYRQKCGTVAPTTCANIADTTVGPFPPGCMAQWWVSAGCTPAGSSAPKIDSVTWYRTDLTAGQVKVDYANYARLAKAGAAGYPSMCGSSCAIADTTVGPFPPGCMAQWWVSAGCTPAGTNAPRTETQIWYRADMTAAQVKTDFNEYARLARAGTGAFPSMCGIGCSVANTAVGPFPSGCMAQWWAAAGCTARGTVAPKIDTMWWYRNDLTAEQVKVDFNNYARLAKAGTGTFPAMCGL